MSINSEPHLIGQGQSNDLAKVIFKLSIENNVLLRVLSFSMGQVASRIGYLEMMGQTNIPSHIAAQYREKANEIGDAALKRISELLPGIETKNMHRIKEWLKAVEEGRDVSLSDYLDIADP